MSNWNVILGADVSKLTVDICYAEKRLHIKIDNTHKGFQAFQKWCKDNGFDLKEVFLVLEHTGGYEYRLLQFCASKSIAFCRVPGLEIKRSLGITRGKSDRVDAFRISEYGQEKIRKLKPTSLPSPAIMELRQLLSMRKRLVRDVAGYTSTIKERKHMYEVKESDLTLKLLKSLITSNSKNIKALEARIKELIKTSEELLRSYTILTSIKGIGKINGWMTIAYTENFASFTDARKYAAYVGVAPFEHTSGTSIKGKTRVSPIANKELKQELNQAAKSAMTHDPEIRIYAERKMQNKPYKLVLNNVKFKLILRMFAVIKRGELYVENYRSAA